VAAAAAAAVGGGADVADVDAGFLTCSRYINMSPLHLTLT